jgi:hypothetical protein
MQLGRWFVVIIVFGCARQSQVKILDVADVALLAGDKMIMVMPSSSENHVTRIDVWPLLSERGELNIKRPRQILS